ncbi:hypothetical protein RJT34_18076 [Clitoria ternatea]|uniref:Uncharacterized protein n=1 Tax=Clitoria ternatea TaxID=43366 RepID=A0AAN9JBL6_CLITE
MITPSVIDSIVLFRHASMILDPSIHTCSGNRESIAHPNPKLRRTIFYETRLSHFSISPSITISPSFISLSKNPI